MATHSGSKGRAARICCLLNQHLEKSLIAYAVAGAGMVVLAPTASAQIVYTPVQRTFEFGEYGFDLNHDGTRDFNINNDFFSYYGFYSATVGILGSRPGAAIVGKAAIASVLPDGVPIGSSDPFITISHRPPAGLMKIHCFYHNCKSGGPWKNVKDQYLGMRVVVNGEVHYGWARLSAHASPQGFGFIIGVRIGGYAYETTPNKTILAGDRGFGVQAGIQANKLDDISLANRPLLPASLGLLSVGAQGIPVWRKPAEKRAE